MMKIWDPVIFGQAVSCYYESPLQKWSEERDACGFKPNNGIADLLKRIEALPADSVLAKTLNSATEILLNNGQLPSPEVGRLDNRGSHYYLAAHWAQTLASQKENEPIAQHFQPLAAMLESSSHF